VIIGNIPNLLTLTRILLLPFFAGALIYKQYHYALILFITAAVTDLLDGLLARMMKQITDLGKILDPVADKFFIVTAFVLMSNTGMIPKWLTIIVISKDLIVVTGCVILYFITNRLEIEPIMLGKVASAVQFFVIGLVLIPYNMDTGFEIPMSVFIIVAALTGLAALQYAFQGMKRASEQNGKSS
jgi:cardiolipin synthase